MNHSRFRGVWTAIATPFKEDFSIDWVAYEHIISRQIAAEITGIVVSGTTGEAQTLTDDEQSELIKVTKSIVGQKLLLMAGVGTNSTKNTMDRSVRAMEAGADCLLVVTPPYSKPSIAGLRAHYQAIAKASCAPICLYHVPGRTGQKLSAAELSAICEIDEVVMVKEASADLVLFSNAEMMCAAQLFSGDDPTFLPSLSVGASGVISVVANLFPREMRLMGEAFWRGEHDQAMRYHQAIMPMNRALYCESNPGPLKFALSQLKICKNVLRLPLVSVTQGNEIMIQTALKATSQNLLELSDV